MNEQHVTDAEIDELRRLCAHATPAPWRAMVEGRDHSAGDSFIMIGRDDDRDEDMYVTRDLGAASNLALISLQPHVTTCRGLSTRSPSSVARVRRSCCFLTPAPSLNRDH